jgi:DNA-binding transcriptional LysR family regulator
MQIKQLEENISLPLFEQLGKRIHLTEAGNELYQYSRAIAAAVRLIIEVALDELKGMERGKLNIAVVTTANYFRAALAGEILSALQRCYGEL